MDFLFASSRAPDLRLFSLLGDGVLSGICSHVFQRHASRGSDDSDTFGWTGDESDSGSIETLGFEYGHGHPVCCMEHLTEHSL